MNKDNSESVSLSIKSATWTKETNDLFDFDTKDVLTTEVKTLSTTYIVSLDEKIEFVKKRSELSKLVITNQNKIKIIAEASPVGNGNFQVLNPFHSLNLAKFDKLILDRIWYVIPKNETKEVNEGDIIKLGRVRLKIDKVNIKQAALETNHMNLSLDGINYQSNVNVLYTHKESNNILLNSATIKLPLINNLNMSATNDDLVIDNEKILNNKENVQCRICFLTDSDLSDPLITPCKCSGSMKYIHFKCLKECISVKTTKKSSDNYLFQNWKSYECEICLAEYPKYIKYKTFNYNLVDLTFPFDQYILFDYSLYDDEKKKSFRKGFIVVKFNEKDQITIGRTLSNIIRIKDISVSRYHCTLTKKEGKIYVEDNGSKFGTLLYVNKPLLMMNINETLRLSSGKSVFNFSLVKNWNIFSGICNTWCCKYKNEDEFILNLEKEELQTNKDNCVNDSYEDYVIYLETIIKNNNNSFIV